MCIFCNQASCPIYKHPLLRPLKLDRSPGAFIRLFKVCRRPRPLPGKNPGDKAARREILPRGEERCASLPNAYGTHLVHLKQRSQPGLVSTVKSGDLTEK